MAFPHSSFTKEGRYASFQRARQELGDWFLSESGQQLLGSEQQLLQQLECRLSGYHLMQLSYVSGQQAFYSFDHPHCFNVSLSETQPGNAIAEYESLPLPSEVIDTVLLHHVLEFSDNPHRVLNEVSRVVIPGGHMVLIMFNPVSLLGLLRPVKYFSSSAIWHFGGLRPARVVDWLQLLHFQPCAMLTSNLLFPLLNERLKPSPGTFMTRLMDAGVLLGAVTVIVARKTQLRPITGMGFPRRAKQAVGMKYRTAHKKTIQKKRNYEES